MGGFNLLELMNKVTKNEAMKPEYEIKELSLGQIVPNPDNLYSMEGIDELADSILLAGRVLQNIVVTAADENGKHMIISGHRRHLACKRLVEAGHLEFGTITALIENETDKSMRELMLIYTNSTSRILTDAEKMRQAQRATDILKNLKAEGKFDGRIREAVARMLKTTSGQLARYAAIANNLTNETLKEAFDDGRLGVSAAYEASRLSEEKQQEVADKLDAAGEVSIRDVKGEGKPSEPEMVREEKTQRLTMAAPIAPVQQDMSPDEPPAEEQPAEEAGETESSQKSMEYAFQTVINELTALEESYRGAAERHTAMGGDQQGKANLSATAHLLSQMIELIKKIEKEDREDE